METKKIYFDYSATTPPDERVLSAFTDAARHYGNYNSLHRAGREAREQIEQATQTVRKLLHADAFDVIYTSGASESNNLAIKGYCEYLKKGHIITTRLEHASVIVPITEMQKKGFHVDFVELTKKGLIDLEQLRSLLREDTVLVSIALVSSELGFAQSVESIAAVLQEHPGVKLHIDATQAIGKITVDLTGADFVSISAHKFYGIKGVGLLLKKKEVSIVKQISGGHSISSDRSGTPAGELIVSLAKALELAFLEGEQRMTKVKKLRELLELELKAIPEIVMNNTSAVPHIVNISIPGKSGAQIQSMLNEKGICVSVGSACSNQDFSAAVCCFTGNKELAMSSFRVSLSHLTTEEEVHTLCREIARLKSD